MKRKKLNLTKMFYNDRFAMVFSVCAAVILWIIMAVTNTQERPIVIEVPITVTLSDSAQAAGLKVFEQSSATAKVSIKGNSVIVHQIKAKDLQVVAQLASSINQPCNVPLTLSVQKVGTLSDYEASVDPGSIMVSVDYNKSNTFKIENKIKFNKVGDKYFASDLPTLSPDTITVSGPETEVSAIAKVSAEYEVKDTLTETKNFTTKLILYDKDGKQMNSDKLKLSASDVKVTIPVLSRQVTTLTAHFANQPTGLNLSSSQLTIDPVNIEVACPQDTLSKVKTIDLEPINFASISPTKNTFPVNITLLAGCKNLSNIYTANVTVNLNGFTTKTLNVKSFAAKNLAASKSADVLTKSLSVTVVGPASEIASLTDDSLSAQIDMTGKENFTGRTDMPVTFTISGATSSWVYGSYKANINVSEKTSS